MKNKNLNAELVWKQLEGMLVPRLGLSVTEHAVYSYLVRHSRLEGEQRAQFSILGLARHIGLSTGPVRDAVRRLVELGALRLVGRSKRGTWSRCACPKRFARRAPIALGRATRDGHRRPAISQRWTSCQTERRGQPSTRRTA